MTEDNVRTLRASKPMSAVDIGRWLLQMGSRLLHHDLASHTDVTDAFDPTGFLLVLISDDDVDVSRGGLLTWERFEEAAYAGVHEYEHEYYQASEWSYHRTPQEQREWCWKREALRAVQQADDEAKHPYVCPDDARHRFSTDRGLAIHQRSCRRARDQAEWAAYRAAHPEHDPPAVWETPRVISGES